MIIITLLRQSRQLRNIFSIFYYGFTKFIDLTTSYSNSRIFVEMRKVISGILLVILVTVTIGLPVYRHTCYIFDRSEVSLLELKQCCDPGEKTSQTEIDIKCCSVEHYDTSLQYETLAQESASVTTFAASLVISLSLQPVIQEKSTPMPVFRPPPVANRALLSKIQVFRI